MLAWGFERAGISFQIIDPGHAAAASTVAAGLINPITGQRLVKSWRFETLFPIARETYREMESVLGVPIWREMRVRRVFADERERSLGASARKRAELEPFIQSMDENGWWIGGAARLDAAALLASTRERWVNAGKLRTHTADLESEAENYDRVIDCRGLAGVKSKMFSFVPWEFSKGELLELSIESLEPDVILNGRHWVVPTRPGEALAGATHEPGVLDVSPSEGGRVSIETTVRELVGQGRTFSVTGQRVGIRVHAPDRRPVVGLLPDQLRVGLVNGLGGKGALWAPMLARQWIDHITAGTPFDPEVDVRRFAN